MIEHGSAVSYAGVRRLPVTEGGLDHRSPLETDTSNSSVNSNIIKI